MSLIIKQTRVVVVPVAKIALAIKTDQAALIDAHGVTVASTADPIAFLPSNLEIDLSTGQIVNWQVPTEAQLQEIADAETKYHDFMMDRIFGDVAPTLTTTPSAPQTFESAAVTVANTADYAPPDQQPNSPEIDTFDEPTDADTALCPDVPDSFYESTPCPMLSKGQPEPVATPVVEAEPDPDDVVPVCTLKQKLEPLPTITDNGDLPADFDGSDATEELLQDGVICALVEQKGLKWIARHGKHSGGSTVNRYVALQSLCDHLELGECEINHVASPTAESSGQWRYSLDNRRTGGMMSVIVAQRSGTWTAVTGSGATYKRGSSNKSAEHAIDNLMAKLGLSVSAVACVDTTDDALRDDNKQRYSIDPDAVQAIDASDEIAYSGDTEIPAPAPVAAANPDQIDIEQAIAEALERPEPVMDLSQPAPVDVVTKLDMHPSVVRDQLSFASAGQADPIYVAFFTASGLMEDGKLSSKGFRLLTNLGNARGIGSATQMIENAIELTEKPATYAEIVGLINHAKTKIHCLALMDRIGKHENTEERRRLFALQKERIDAFNADSAA
ncbi:MAG: hypothetical protein VXW65_02320 [Pseudomonadota bacterium]|nr:hypothetical protein [Pseudomonadota bacterium]